MAFLPEFFSRKRVAGSEEIYTHLADSYAVRSGRFRFLKYAPSAKIHICYSKNAKKWLCGKLGFASDGYFTGYSLIEFCKADSPIEAYNLYVKKCKDSTESTKR
jgi:hypothetical protein